MKHVPEERPTALRCRHCGKMNPLKAYCCLYCFQVLRPKQEIPWWRASVRPTVPVLLTISFIGLAGILAVKHWMENIEAQVNINLKSAEYNVTVTADKKRKTASIDVTSASEPASEVAPAAEKNPS